MSLLLEFLIRGILLGSVYGLLALPMSLLYTAVGTIDFAVGSYALIAVAVAATVGGVLGIAAGLATAIACAAVMAATYVLLRRSGSNDVIVVALASFGLASALSSLVLWRWGTKAFTLQDFPAPWTLAGIRINPQGVIDLVIGLGLVTGLYVLLYWTDLGRMMRAAAANASGAALAGIPVLGIQAATFLAGGLLAGIAGILILYTAGLDFTAALGLTLSGFGAAIIFGIRSPVLGFCGGLMLGVVQALSAGYTSGSLTAAVSPIFVLVVLLSGGLADRRFSGDRP